MSDVTSTHAGFAPTQYGTPGLLGHVPGFQPTQYGIAGASVPQFAIPSIPSTVVSRAYTAVNTFGLHAGTSQTRIGTPRQNVPFIPGENRTAAATGWLATRIGLPSSPVARTSAAAANPPATLIGIPGSVHLYAFTRYGRPRSTTGHAAATLGALVQVGLPGAGELSQAIGWRATQFGQAIGTPGYLHRARTPQTRYGRPGSSQTGVHAARGFWSPPRIGRPTSTNRMEYPLAGLLVSAQWGTINAYEQHRASALPPVTTIGDHSLQRASTC